jgi:hypothetical protein
MGIQDIKSAKWYFSNGWKVQSRERKHEGASQKGGL